MARTTASLLTSLLLASCTSFDFSEQMIELRHVPETDALEARIVYAGVEAGEAKLETALAAVRSVASGGPPVILVCWPWEFDPRKLSDYDDDSEAARRAVEWAVAFEVRESGAWIDDGGELVLWQAVRWPDATRGLAALDAVLREEWADGRGEELAGAAADPDVRWLELDARGALRVSFPATPQELAEGARELPELAKAFGREILAPLEAIDVRDGLATLVFVPGMDGWIRIPVRKAHVPPSEASLVEAIRSAPQPDGPQLHEPPAWAKSLLRELRQSATTESE